MCFWYGLGSGSVFSGTLCPSVMRARTEIDRSISHSVLMGSSPLAREGENVKPADGRDNCAVLFFMFFRLTSCFDVHRTRGGRISACSHGDDKLQTRCLGRTGVYSCAFGAFARLHRPRKTTRVLKFRRNCVASCRAGVDLPTFLRRAGTMGVGGASILYHRASGAFGCVFGKVPF